MPAGPGIAIAPDQEERERAVHERDRNVLIDAGAGTGKTSILVDRLVEMVAPSGRSLAVPIERMAAITFTRKAAGELRLRIRERVLQELARPGLTRERHDSLRGALGGLDTAYVGTIHSFADRLLRLRPVEAQLSPAYEVVEDESELVRETFELLLHAVENGTLADELAGTSAAARADEATAAILDAIGSGVRSQSRELEWKTDYGLDALVAGFLQLRDIPPLDRPPAPADIDGFRAVADTIARRCRGVSTESRVGRWIHDLVLTLERLGQSDDPVTISVALRRQLERKPREVNKRDTCAGDDATWKMWKALSKGTKVDPEPLLDRLRAPLDRWLATRLVRLFPVVVALYEKVKARHRTLDQLDLLLKLRNLLARDLDVRRAYQQMFDHIFVDEFQDTDPLQAEIVLFLCERAPRASRWQDVELASGKLTLVGDPKQSIYRFRRADVAMYDSVREAMIRGAALPCRLAANFRGVPSLIEWLNDRFQRVLGVSQDGRPFDPATGVVFHQPLLPGREGPPTVPLHVVPFDLPAGVKSSADGYRALEGQVLARYLRWLVEANQHEILDPLERRPRPVRYGDIAVLAVSTWRLTLLFPHLDEQGIPYASRGGTLFLEDPLHRQFLLGLRAIADRDDGIAEAALLRPPFFAVDPADLLLEQAARRAGGEGDVPPDNLARIGRAREARDLVREFRRRRFERSPGVTARDLLDLTAFARTVALGPNGAQRLARLRELCLVLEQLAATEGLDYDAATARLRGWVDAPVQLDPPYPVGAEAVQVLTVHQAKGLEFPVVVLWDGRCQWDTRVQPSAWRMERDGRGWVLDLDGLTWEEPAGLALRDTEKQYLLAERRRVVYVAATRARDLLVLPKAGTPALGKVICSDLLDGSGQSLGDVVKELESYRETSPPGWVRSLASPPPSQPVDAARVQEEVASRWEARAMDAARPRFRPASVSGEAVSAAGLVKVVSTDGEDPALLPVDTSLADTGLLASPPGGLSKPREGRFGSLFGHTVHLAIGLALREPGWMPEVAVRLAAAKTGLIEHVEEAVADVTRAIEVLATEGLRGPLGPGLRIEYPVAGSDAGGSLLAGYADLVAVSSTHVTVLDFKTDTPPAGPVEAAYPHYVAQVRAYGRLLTAAGVVGDRSLRCGLLFTASGEIRWV